MTEVSRVEQLKKNLESDHEIHKLTDFFIHFTDISVQIKHAKHFAKDWIYSGRQNKELIKCSETKGRDLIDKQEKTKTTEKKRDLEKHNAFFKSV